MIPAMIADTYKTKMRLSLCWKNAFLAVEYSVRVGLISFPPSFDFDFLSGAFAAAFDFAADDLGLGFALAFALAGLAARSDAASKRCACGLTGVTCPLQTSRTK